MRKNATGSGERQLQAKERMDFYGLRLMGSGRRSGEPMAVYAADVQPYAPGLRPVSAPPGEAPPLAHEPARLGNAP